MVLITAKLDLFNVRAMTCNDNNITHVYQFAIVMKPPNIKNAIGIRNLHFVFSDCFFLKLVPECRIIVNRRQLAI